MKERNNERPLRLTINWIGGGEDGFFFSTKMGGFHQAYRCTYARVLTDMLVQKTFFLASYFTRQLLLW